MKQRKFVAMDSHGNPSDHAADRGNSATRRQFFTGIPATAAVTLAASAVPFGSSAEASKGGDDGSDGSGTERALASYEIREEAARAEATVPIPRQLTNGDEQKYSSFIGNYSKGLPHNPIGEVDQAAYLSLLKAVQKGTAAAFENVPLGGDTLLVNPLAGVAFDLEATDSHQLAIPPFPSLASQTLANQAVELYWMALCRDVNFANYATDATTLAAVYELSTLPAFTGVTPQTLFRGSTADDVIGPYVSQFLLKPFSYGPYAMTGTMRMYASGVDYLTDQDSWLACQNGNASFGQNAVDPVRHTCTGRDLTVYVHTDPNAGLLISFYNAGIWLFEQGAPLNPGNPYTKYKTQTGFATFGVPHFLGLLGEAKQRACKAVWYAKWFVHRALRPEAYGGLVHMTKTGQKKPAGYPLHSDVLNSKALTNVFAKYGTYFLPQAFPEGSPQHPSYAQGHASMAGACATILKAAFDGTIQLNTLGNGTIEMASGDGLSLVPYRGSDRDEITVNGEINKLASNIGHARDFAGIHWRSDLEQGLRLGEAVAISLLRDQSKNYAGEDFDGFTITKFDGTTIKV